MDWRTLATSYGFEIVVIILLINIGFIWPERLQLAQKYQVTEIIPMPSLQPKAFKPKTAPVVHAKLLPKAPVFPTAKLTVPRDIRTPQQPDIAPPKIVMNNFEPTILKQVSGARPTLVVHTGQFGSSAVATVNAPIQKVQTGGFGDPNGIPGQGKPNAHLTMANTGSFDLPPGAGMGNGTGGSKGIKGRSRAQVLATESRKLDTVTVVVTDAVQSRRQVLARSKSRQAERSHNFPWTMGHLRLLSKSLTNQIRFIPTKRAS